MKNLEYHDLYVQSNTLLLAAVYKNDDDIASRHLFFLLTLSKKWSQTAHFNHIRLENDFDVSTCFLTCSKYKI